MLAATKKCVLVTAMLTFPNAIGAMNDGIESLIDKFHTAAAEGDLEEIKQLVLEKEVDVNYQASGNITALYQAAWCGYFEVVQWLVEEANARTDLADHLGRTPLHMAALTGRFPIVYWRITQGYADLDQPTHRGHTALYCSVARGYIEIARWLLKQGANPTVFKSLGEQPSKNDNRVSSLLQEHNQYLCSAKKATRNLLVSQSSQWETLLLLLHQYLGWDVIPYEKADKERHSNTQKKSGNFYETKKLYCPISCVIL